MLKEIKPGETSGPASGSCMGQFPAGGMAEGDASGEGSGIYGRATPGMPPGAAASVVGAPPWG